MAKNAVLWSFPLSFAAQRARLGLEEKKIPYSLKSVNLLTGENFKADYFKINSNATIPTLVVDDKVIGDSVEILKYADSIGEPLGGENADQAKVSEWLSKFVTWNDNLYTYANQGKGSVTFLSSFRLKVLEARKKENPSLADVYDRKIEYTKKLAEDFQKPEIVETEHKKLVDILDSADIQLSQTKYLAGEAFSMADVGLVTILARVEMLKKEKELVEPRPALAKFWTEAKTRASYKKVVGAATGVAALPILVGTLSSITLRNLSHRY